MSEKSNLVLSSSKNRPMIIAIGDDIKLMVVIENNRTKIVIEAPKSIPIKKLNELEKALLKNQKVVSSEF